MLADKLNGYLNGPRTPYINTMGHDKPRVYLRHYKTLDRREWRVSVLPKPYNIHNLALWAHAHKLAGKLNEDLNGEKNELHGSDGGERRGSDTDRDNAP